MYSFILKIKTLHFKFIYILAIFQCMVGLMHAQDINEGIVTENDNDSVQSFSPDTTIINIHEDISFQVHNDSLIGVAPIVIDKFIPNSTKAVWYSAIFPGLGQIYNKKYWKLPIVYGGFLGIVYGLSFNQRYYTDYSIAYRDFMDDNDDTNSYMDFIPESYPENKIGDVLKRKKDFYRRYRDLSIIGLIAMYAICMVDAYVDAELYTFDISKDLSLSIEPVIMQEKTITNSISYTTNKALGLQCNIKF